MVNKLPVEIKNHNIFHLYLNLLFIYINLIFRDFIRKKILVLNLNIIQN
jgi:hypothetical protein